MSHVRSLGLPEFQPPMAVSTPLPFLAAPVCYRGESVGAIYVGEKEQEFTSEDEETLVMFASQAALVIANARKHRDEQRARTDLEALVNTAPVGVVVFDARTGNPVSVNRETRRIASDLHMPDGSFTQVLEVLTFRRADGRKVSLEELPLVKALNAGETVRAEEFVIEVPGGRSVTVLVNATPIRTDEGEIESVVVTLQDMTPLEEVERQRAEFLGMVSHELRTPVTSIKGSTTTLLDDSIEPDLAEMRQLHRIIDHQADYMRDLISDLLDVARIEAGTLPVAPEPTKVVALVDEARNRFLSGGGRSNLHIDLPSGLPPVVADRRRIVQVLGNLLSNAARHSHESSVIRVSAVPDGVHVAFSVADEGRGVPAERLPHLFRKFYRLDEEDRRDDLGGTGLGLAICKGIVEAHGVHIWAESDGPGLGSRFTFTVPAAEEATAQTSPPSSRRLQAEREQTRILVVDDDPQTLRYVRGVLSEAGYTPIVTGDPEDVLRLIEEEEPHLVLLDLVLPGSDGIELMKDILDIVDVPVIFLSVYSKAEIVARVLDMGAADYMFKPFSATELAARIRAALRNRAAPQQTELSEPYVLGDLAVDYGLRSVTVAGRPIELTDVEYRMLSELSVNAGRVLTHDQLLHRIWGSWRSGDSGPVRTIVKRLRQKLGDDANSPRYIFTEPRVGYRMGRGEGPEKVGPR